MALLQPAPTGSAPVPAAVPTDVVADLDEALRAAVRREGIDPQREVSAVRRIADQLVRDHDERSLTGVVAPVGDPDGVVTELLARVAGFGALQPFLDDPTVEEIWINSPDRVFVARNGRHELTNLVLTEAQVNELVERMLKTTGRRVDLSRPFVDAMLPQGHRLHVVLQGISRGFSAVNTASSLTCQLEQAADGLVAKTRLPLLGRAVRRPKTSGLPGLVHFVVRQRSGSFRVRMLLPTSAVLVSEGPAHAAVSVHCVGFVGCCHGRSDGGGSRLARSDGGADIRCHGH